MHTDERGGLALLHDLALVYLGLAKGADDDFDPEEKREVAARLRHWQPDKDPALIDHVMRDVSMTYEKEANTEQVRAAVDAIGDRLGEPLCREILTDLADIARADGIVLTEEEDFIEHIAEAWNLDREDDLEAPRA